MYPILHSSIKEEGEILRSLALKIPQIKALISQRNALLTERDTLLKAQDAASDLAAQKAASDQHADELLVANTQLSQALKHANGLPVPPRHLQVRVVGGYYPDFLASATHTLCEFDRILKFAARSLNDFDRVLDLGVGCGRVVRRFHELYPNAVLTGADIDAEAIAWLEQHYAPVGNFVTLPHLPPSEFEDSSFDLIYAVSVFTHLDEGMQFAWLGELQRITKPGGCLLLTVHGKNHHVRHPPDIQQKIAAGFFFHDGVGLTDGLPAFYKAAFHTRAYVEREWLRFFDVLRYEELGAEGHQDLILCRKRGGAS